MGTSANQGQPGRSFDVVILVALIIICLGGLASFLLSSSRGLAFTQFLISLLGLPIGTIQILRNWRARLQGNVERILRYILIALILVTISLQGIILANLFSSRNAKIIPPCCPTSTALLVLSPTPNPTVPPTPTSPIPTQFVFTAITTGSSKSLSTSQPVGIALGQLPITVTGTYTAAGSGQAWVVVEDKFGQYYLQTIPVRFADGGQEGAWRASNINTSVGTVRIDFVYVTPQGNDLFQKKSDAHDYKAFTQLPDGSKIIMHIDISVTK